MTIMDVRSIIERERDFWRFSAQSYNLMVNACNHDVSQRFYDAMSKWEVLTDLLFQIDMTVITEG